MPPEAFPMSVFRLAAALALFITLAVAASLPASTYVDRAMTVWLQRAAPTADAPTAALVLLGDPEVIPGLAAVGLVLLLLRDKRHGRAMLWLAAGAVGVSLLADVLQDAIVHPGPPLTLMRPVAQRERIFLGNREVILGLAAAGLVLLLLHGKRHGRALLWLAVGAVGVSLVTVIFQDAIVQIGQQALGIIGLNSTYGFPSGHMMRTTLLAGTVLRRVPALGVTIVVGMAASLVYLGVHSMSEVVGGFCLGWACVEVARGIWQQLG